MKINPDKFISILETYGIEPPEQEYRFHPERKWRFDFAWPSKKLAVEVEGGVWLAIHGGKSRHFHGTGAIKDMEKYNHAAAIGWRVMKITPQQWNKNEVLQLIQQAYFFKKEIR